MTTRRLAAILAADVVGYSAMMERNEEDTLARIKALQREVIEPKVTQHQGRIVKTTGDGLLVEFASPVEAVRCATAIQDALKSGPIQLRIGINLGDIIIEDDSDVYGEGVNVAARLEALCDPGEVLISGKVFDEVEGKIERTFENQGEQTVKNITRPVRVYVVRSPTFAKASAISKARTLPDKPSIAVLPFTNMSGDPEQEYFADGIVEDITTGLSRIKWLFVIARNSSFTFKGKNVDVRDVGRTLGVRYVLEGGVRKAGSRVRITAQLTETATGAHLWADRFDGALQDIFELQDQITDKVVAIIEPSLQRSEIERSRRKRPDSLDAYDLYLRAVPYTASQTAEDGKIAIQYLEDALRLEQDYPAAHALLAWCYEWCYSRAGFHEADKHAALAHARAALRGGTDDATALAVAGFVITMLSKDHEAGLNASERGLALNPSCATALYLGAITNAFAGRPGPAREQASRALRLSPFDLLAYLAHLAQGVAAVQEGRLKEAGAFMERMVQANSSLSSLYFIGSAALALAGRLEVARSWAEQGFEKEPSFQPRLFSELMASPVADTLTEGWRLLDFSNSAFRTS